MERRCGRVALVGAGCGPADWITVKGLSLLRACDAVVYDDLIDPALLAQAPEGAERIPVGKRAGRCSPRQADIDETLVRLAGEGKFVVRLKGGDPFVFGRGGEEALALRAAGIPYEVVPGISSALAIPMEAGIPVTHRSVSRSVHIVTAHTAEDVLPEHLAELARLDGTLVFLMGLGQLPTLARELMKAGMDPATAAAVASGGNSPHPACTRGTLADIADRAAKAGIIPPAVIVIGDVAAMDLRDPAAYPLTGVRVGLTGTPEFQQKLRAPLAALGAEVRAVQTTLCEALPAAIPWDELGADETKWLAFTSARGVEQLFRRMREERTDLRILGRCRFAAIGKATGEALWGHGFRADLCPAEYTSQALAQALAGAAGPEETVWLFQAQQGSDAVQRTLGERCRVIPLYRAEYRLEPETGPVDYLLFGSAGAVHALADAGYVLAEGTAGVCVGPVCARAFESRFGKKARFPAEYTAQAMAELILN